MKRKQEEKIPYSPWNEGGLFLNGEWPGQKTAKRKKIRQAARLLLAILGVLLLTGGILQGGYQDTLQKAVRICLECVGIG